MIDTLAAPTTRREEKRREEKRREEKRSNRLFSVRLAVHKPKD